FRIGSTSKLFTWTAVMQLVQQGKLDLDKDVNTYLTDFKIPATYAKPVTLRSLMTHSPGFEDGALGYLISNDSASVKSIDETLKPHAVTGYVYANGVYEAKPFEFVGGFRPAGSVSASALDMTHFMIAHLQDGRYGDTRILDSATAERMHTRNFANDPRLPAMALGFYEQKMGGVRVIGHEGDTQYFHTAMFIVPTAQVGIFMSYVGTGAEPLREGILQAFFNRYFPPPPVVAMTTPDSFAASAVKYTGTYRFARHSSTKIDKALLVAGPSIDVSVLPKERRLLVTGLGEHPAQFAPVGDGLFRQVGGGYTI